MYASVGRKPALVLAVIDMVLGDADQPSPAVDRGYVREIREAATGAERITTYARALAGLLPVIAPLQEALREAGRTDEECAAAWSGLVDRRAANMLLFARGLRGTGRLRGDLEDREVADLVWATSSAECFLLLARRGWSPDRFGVHLADLWCRALLDPGDGRPDQPPSAARPAR